jgi:hypothetical protein
MVLEIFTGSSGGNSSAVVISLMPHTHIESHEEILKKVSLLASREQPMLLLPALSADPNRIRVGSPLYVGNHLKSAMLMSPYFQLSQAIISACILFLIPEGVCRSFWKLSIEPAFFSFHQMTIPIFISLYFPISRTILCEVH